MKHEGIRKLYYSISEVAEITGLEAHVLRYWETEFEQLRPKKNRAGNRVYTDRDIAASCAGSSTSSARRSTRSRGPARSSPARADEEGYAVHASSSSSVHSWRTCCNGSDARRILLVPPQRLFRRRRIGK
jgi:hypothetical protein